jgi:N-carbamoylputrescine amidase
MAPNKFIVGACECAPELVAPSREWDALCREVSRQGPDVLLLNEMPFGRWIASRGEFSESAWNDSCQTHMTGLERLAELGAKVVAGSRPVLLGSKRVNQGFVWTKEEGLAGCHTKQFFPDEEGYYETRWFQAGPSEFHVTSAGVLRVGFLICTEVMFNEHARRYGRMGADVILVPRAVGGESLARWLVAARMAAIVSGCYVVSSNRAGTDSTGQSFGGAGWIINPFGDLVAQTSGQNPVVFHEIDTELVRRAQGEYPCYVKE